MYDQYRVSGVRAQFELVGASAGSGTTAIPAVYAFATAIDRNGVTLTSGNPVDITSQQMRGMSSYLPATYYSGSKFRSVRQFYPSTMLERSQYLPTSASVPSAGELPGFVGPDAAAFNPWMYFQVSNLVSTATSPQSFTIVVNFDVAVTFRALRLNNRNWLPSNPNPPTPAEPTKAILTLVSYSVPNTDVQNATVDFPLEGYNDTDETVLVKKDSSVSSYAEVFAIAYRYT